MINHIRRIALQTLSCLLLSHTILGCAEDNPLKIPVPENEISVDIERLDQAWFEMSAVGFRNANPQWKAAYGELYKRYIEDVLQLGKENDSNLFVYIRQFTTDPNMLEVHAEVQKQYPDLSDLEAELSDAWAYYQYYFPDRNIPKHLSFIGGFNTPAALTQEAIGIGLEMFLGRSCDFYEYLQLPLYIRERMTKEHVVPTVMHGWIGSEFPLDNLSPTLLEAIIAEGKVLYALDAVLPFTPDHLKIRYSQEQLAWAEAHQEYVWAHFIDKNILFSTNSIEIQKFTGDGPFNPDLVKESPPRMGHFIGWQIVRAFMKRQDKINLPRLMSLNAETILTESKYKP